MRRHPLMMSPVSLPTALVSDEGDKRHPYVPSPVRRRPGTFRYTNTTPICGHTSPNAFANRFAGLEVNVVHPRQRSSYPWVWYRVPCNNLVLPFSNFWTQGPCVNAPQVCPLPYLPRPISQHSQLSKSTLIIMSRKCDAALVLYFAARFTAYR